MTTFAVVSGVEGAGLSPRIVLILGVANLVGDGFSMAAGNYLSTKAERQRRSEAERPATDEPADEAGPAATESPVAKTPVADTPNPLRAALVTFVAFAAAGAVPLLPYALGPVLPYALGPVAGRNPAPLSAGLTAATFFGIGAGKALFVRTRWWLAGLESLAIGGAAAALAYYCGALLAGLA
ncbi:VIT family protein [Alienimonas californiensis]|uniref:VIT family protein n=1 Tax=Alienimonas californiensis TaxID=2527989 RepID=A0A517PB93_9PLAN|nr:VIT family protein [Alienimonas californiensis]